VSRVSGSIRTSRPGRADLRAIGLLPSKRQPVYGQPMNEHVVTRQKIEGPEGSDWLHPPKTQGDDDGRWELHSWNIEGGVLYAVWTRPALMPAGDTVTASGGELGRR
jgi:hypothetical protein